MDSILFIDDEETYSRHYIDNLQKNYRVVWFDNANEGLREIRQEPGHKCLVLDIMMPPPDDLPAALTEDGLLTGLWLLREVQALVIERPLPVLLLTNRSRDFVKGQLGTLAFPQGLVELLLKFETPAFYLPRRVEQAIRRWAR